MLLERSPITQIRTGRTLLSFILLAQTNKIKPEALPPVQKGNRKYKRTRITQLGLGQDFHSTASL
jgi:hypothetical protein